MDIRHYFESIDHQILLLLVRKKIKDEKIIWLIETILNNHTSKLKGKGMPLGNLTSQFFANFYLNELDYFIKHSLKAKYYLRYVDDFVILHLNKKQLERWKFEINSFLRVKLNIESHPEKSMVIPLRRGITFLGFRIFSKYRLLKKSNARRIWKRLQKFKFKFDKGELPRDTIFQSLDGWLAYAEFANTYEFRKRIVAKFNELFCDDPYDSIKG
ncbi:RNA-directed DNA polymerase [Candidatus Micrarchaeota archaeon]|nr:RNA-directed DNA polymerase [Candidatus Micrarchaeota archaeon]